MKIGFLPIGLLDVLDILLVAFLLYQIYFLIRGSIASRVFMGYLLVYVLYVVVRALGMELLTTILGQFMEIGVLAFVILFQPEIRRFLLFIGRSATLRQYPLLQRLFYPRSADHTGWELQPVIEAVRKLAAERTGALVVIGREDNLRRYIETGELLDAHVSRQLLLSIFQKNSPLHDGAVIIADNRIKAARCMLPVTENTSHPPTLGFRHRAAAGMSEFTDAAVVVVSEERGEISLVTHGDFRRALSVSDLHDALTAYLAG